MKVYIICPVRNVTDEQKQEIEDYVKKLEEEGNEVHYPPRDVEQDDPTGVGICDSHLAAMAVSERVDVFWDVESSGSHFDLGMAYAMRKILKLVKAYKEDNDGKSYLKVIKEKAAQWE